MSGLYPFLVSIGAVAVVSCTCQNKHAWAFLALSLGCLAAAVYCFTQGNWPFVVIDAIFAVGAFARWVNACSPKTTADFAPADR